MTPPPVLERRDGAIAVVTLNRPEALNALNLEMRDLLPQVLDGLNADDAVRAVVLTGAGGRAFSAGQDLNDSAGFDATTVQEHFLHLGALYQAKPAGDP
ncbi:MAG: enoyl-CoA hydratase/isomerase family protein, partial [Alphaproteobacteria bacterium]|nr:enoyl-CoA hydratase/isomerase family protein [Alphaproteobacteria bacterium]